MTLSKKALLGIAERNNIDAELLKGPMAGELTGDVGEDDILRVPFRIGITLNRSMCHASKFFRELRDNGIFYGGKCPECGHALFPPIRPICLRCIKKGEMVEYEPMEMGPEVRGVVVAVSKLARGTSKDLGKGAQYPCLVKVDGADNAHWQLVAPPAEGDVKVGMRVKSSPIPQEERSGEMRDYLFVID